MQVPKLYRWTRLLSFKIFLVAFVVTLISLSLLGRWCSQQNPYQNFVRFHQLITPEALYYPTISHLRAIAKEQLQDQDKVGVIVGGSSVFNGATQPPNRIWTKHLQELLGDRYRVVNFALPSGRVQGGGAIAAQSLLNEGYKIIFTSDMTGKFTLDGGEVYNYFLWDAVYKKLIKDDSTLRREIDLSQIDRSRWNELNLRMWLDSVFYFNDLWTSIGYRYFFTVWNFLIAGDFPAQSFTKPRSQTLDPESKRELKPVPERYKVLGNDEMVHDIIIKACNYLLDEKKQKPRGIDDINHDAQIAFPKSFHQHTLLVINHASPYYLETLPSQYQGCWQKGTALVTQEMQKNGYWALDIGREVEFTAEDFGDFLHLSPQGGMKLAESLAPKIQQIATSLGYLK